MVNDIGYILVDKKCWWHAVMSKILAIWLYYPPTFITSKKLAELCYTIDTAKISLALGTPHAAEIKHDDRVQRVNLLGADDVVIDHRHQRIK